jgi:arylsulfatase A-like enzyme
MNLILVTMDTLRYDYIGANGNDWIETPNLDRLAGESWVFDHAYTASYPTIPHRTDLMTGANGKPFHTWRPLPWEAPALPRALAHAGYCTQLLADTPHLINGGHNFDYPFGAWQFIRGAEVDHAWIDDRPAEMGNWFRDPLLEGFDPGDAPPQGFWYRQPYCSSNRGRQAHADWNCAQLFQRAGDFLRDNASRENFFLWIDCFDPHEPWDVPPEFMCKYDRTPGYDGHLDPRLLAYRNHPDLPEAARRRVAASYAAKVSWVDHCFGALLAALDGTALARNTAVVVTADHGTQVAEYGRFGKKVPVREQEGHVPLILHVPDGGRGRCGAIVQPQDITATLLGLGKAQPLPGLDGQDLLALARNGGEGRRALALSGTAADKWNPAGILCTLFNRDWSLEVAATPERSVLRRLGRIDEAQEEHPQVVLELHAAALDELARRGAHPELMHWLRRGGPGGIPGHVPRHAFAPMPPGYTSYWEHSYLDA